MIDARELLEQEDFTLPKDIKECCSRCCACKNMITESQVIEKLRGVYDPEIPINLYDLGLIYEINFEGRKKVKGDAREMLDNGISIEESDESFSVVEIVMSLTTPHCGLKDMIIDQVVMAVETIEDANCEVRLTFDPQWTPTMLRQEAIEELGENHPLAQMATGV